MERGANPQQPVPSIAELIGYNMLVLVEYAWASLGNDVWPRKALSRTD